MHRRRRLRRRGSRTRTCKHVTRIYEVVNATRAQ